jgi:hypothetical protein
MQRGIRSIASAPACFGAIGLRLALCVTLHAATFTPVPSTKVVHEHDPNNHIPVFSGDAFLSLRGNQSATPAIEAIDLQGNPIGFTSIVVPDARITGINCFSRGSDGTVAAGGWSTSYEGKTAAFVAASPGPGQALNIIRTNPYVPRQLAVGADGTVWTAGEVVNRKSEPPDADPEGGTLRHFDRSGKLLESFFPYSRLNDRVRVAMGFLAAAHDRIGWISTGDPHDGKERLGAYVEFTANGKVDEYPLPPIAAQQAGAVLYGLALTDDGSALATVLVAPDKLQMFSLHRSTRAWEPVNPPGLPSRGAQFLSGASGNTIAIWTQDTKDVHFYRAAK